MEEEKSNPAENTPKITRSQVVDAFRIFPGQGISNPDDLPADDPNLKSAEAILSMWIDQREAEVAKVGTDEARLLFSLDRSTLYYDAGFTDPDYVDEVANEWLVQDLQEAEDAGLSKVAARIEEKIKEMNSKIS